MTARFTTAHSSITYARLCNDPGKWYMYHTLYREARMELLGVSHGVDLIDLPQRATLARLLAEAHLPGCDA